MENGKISFKLKNEVSELNTLCDRIGGFCETLALNQKNLFEINLALDELFTNIISYGFSDALEHFIQVDITCNGSLLTIRVEDDGRPFNPTQAAAPNVQCILEDRGIGGLGIFLIKKVMDQIIYERKNGKNVLVLKKKLDGCSNDRQAGDAL